MLNNKGHVLAFDSAPIAENSPLDSVAYNKIIDSLKSSTLRCINRSRDLNTSLAKMNKALSAENLYLASLVGERNLGYSTEANTALVTGYDELVYAENADQEYLTGQVTIHPTNKWSKVIRYLDRNGRNRASKDISISINGVTQPLDSDIYTILDGYKDSYWLYETTKGANHTIRIQFPASIKPYVDYLSMVPFPAFGFTINSITVTRTDSTPIQLADLSSKELGILDMHFKPISWGGTIEINLTANSSVIGIADLDIGLEDYYQGKTPASFVFEVPGFLEKTFSRIEYIDLSMFDLYGIGNDPSYIKTDKIQVYVYHTAGPFDPNATGEKINIDTLSPITINNVTTGKGFTNLLTTKAVNENFYIKFTMAVHLGQTPIFRAAKIKYGV